MRLSKKFLLDIFFFVVLFASSGAMEAFTQGKTGTDSEGSPVMKVLWAFIFIAVLISAIVRRSQIYSLIRSNKCFTLLLLLAIYSTRWSVDPGMTIRKSIPLLLSALVGLDFASRYSIREQLRLLSMVLALVVTLGVIAQVFFPGFVPDADFEPGTAWNGIVTTKNTWARLIVLTGVVILSRSRPTRKSSILVAVAILAVLGLLVASQSTGGLLIMVVMMGMFVAFKALHWRRRPLLVTLSSVAIASVVFISYAVGNLGHLTKLLGKDATLTGRVPIWTQSLHFVQKNPIWGYGYGAFWSQLSRPGRLVREAVNWDLLPHAHNGYIDLTLQLGLIGLGLYTAAFLIGLWRGARLYRRSNEREAAWPLAFLVVVFLYQLEEASIVSANQLVWILFSTVLFSLTIEENAYESVSMPASGVFSVKEPALMAGD